MRNKGPLGDFGFFWVFLILFIILSASGTEDKRVDFGVCTSTSKD